MRGCRIRNGSSICSTRRAGTSTGYGTGYVATGLADPDAVLVLDDTQAIKNGTMSVGVAPQPCGLTGQTENCQCMVMLTYASRHGHAFIDRELYLPKGGPAIGTAAGRPEFPTTEGWSPNPTWQCGCCSGS